ncbi:MAG: glycosyltransferase family 39 protein [Proteobacteria bacterium]|nr:glycosyltransferase family 39 protein [Pseudomonadota bacterium]
MGTAAADTGPDALQVTHPGRVLAGIALLAVLIRTLSAARLGVISNDGPLFLWLAEALAEGRLWDVLAHPYHPLYPGLVAVGHVLGLPVEGAALAISVLAGGVSVILLYALVRDAFGSAIGLLAAGLLAIHPLAISVSADVLSDGLYLALFLAAFWCLWRALERHPGGWAFATGLAAGVAYLTRPEGLGVALLGCAYAGALALRGLWSWRRTAAWGALVALGVASVAGPYLVALRWEHGHWMLTPKKSVAVWLGVTDKAPELGESSIPGVVPSLPRAGEPARGTPAVRTSELVGALRAGLGTTYWLLLALGLVRIRGRPSRRGWLLGMLVAGYALVWIALATQSGYLSRRHVLPPLVPLFGYVALATAWLGTWLGRLLEGRSGLSLRGWRPLALGLALVAILMLPRQIEARRGERLAERRAAEWLRDQDRASGAVAAGKMRIAYYAGEPFVPLPSDPPGGMLAYLESRNVRYVIVDQAKVNAHRGLREAVAEGLSELHRVEARGREALVLELRDVGT